MPEWVLEHAEPVVVSPWLTVSKNRYRLTDGAVVGDYFVVTRSDFVLVVAQRDNGIVLVKQFRPATNRWYLSLPAGYLHAGEDAQAAARRELLEETGLTAATVRLIGELHPLPGYVRSTAHVVVCDGPAGVLCPLDRAEIDAVRLVEWPEALAMIRRGEIVEMQAVSAILLARLALQGGVELPPRDLRQ